MENMGLRLQGRKNKNFPELSCGDNLHTFVYGKCIITKSLAILRRNLNQLGLFRLE